MPKFEQLNPHFKRDIEEKVSRQYFMRLLDLKLTSIDVGLVRAELHIEEKHLQQHHFVHGGVMSTAADVVMGFAAYSVIPEGKGVVTSDLNISYLNPGVGDRVLAEGRVVKAGGTLVFCEADVWVEKNGERTQTNRATSTMCVVEGG